MTVSDLMVLLEQPPEVIARVTAILKRISGDLPISERLIPELLETIKSDV